MSIGKEVSGVLRRWRSSTRRCAAELMRWTPRATPRRPSARLVSKRPRSPRSQSKPIEFLTGIIENHCKIIAKIVQFRIEMALKWPKKVVKRGEKEVSGLRHRLRRPRVSGALRRLCDPPAREDGRSSPAFDIEQNRREFIDEDDKYRL